MLQRKGGFIISAAVAAYLGRSRSRGRGISVVRSYTGIGILSPRKGHNLAGIHIEIYREKCGRFSGNFECGMKDVKRITLIQLVFGIVLQKLLPRHVAVERGVGLVAHCPFILSCLRMA
ncbi:hypothetical protein D3C81_1635690 [compost metagenome]